MFILKLFYFYFDIYLGEEWKFYFWWKCEDRGKKFIFEYIVYNIDM